MPNTEELERTRRFLAEWVELGYEGGPLRGSRDPRRSWLRENVEGRFTRRDYVGLLAALRDGYLEEIGRLVRRVALVDSVIDGAARAER